MESASLPLKTLLWLPTAKNLVVVAKQLMERHGGKVPCTLAELEALAGIAEKGAAILVNEIFGLVEAIAVDRHVEDISSSLNFFYRAGWLKEGAAVDRKHVEMSLRTWVPVQDFKNFNPVLGGFAQLFTKLYKSINNIDKKKALPTLMTAMLDRVHRPYHVELLWYTLARVRLHYANDRPKRPAWVRKEDRKPAAKPKSPPKSPPASPPNTKPPPLSPTTTRKRKAAPVTPTPTRKSTRTNQEK